MKDVLRTFARQCRNVCDMDTLDDLLKVHESRLGVSLGVIYGFY
jgi:hypothetical protein